MEINLFWFRRDLRIKDNAGLSYALNDGLPVLPVFIFDRNILNDLSSKSDARIEFIHRQVFNLSKELSRHGSSLYVVQDRPLASFKEILSKFKVRNVFTNEDYEPYAIKRDAEVKNYLNQQGIGFQSYKDQVIFAKNDLLKSDGTPYTVFTPYSKQWLHQLLSETESGIPVNFKPFLSEELSDRFLKARDFKVPELEDLGFFKSNNSFPQSEIDLDILNTYDKKRDFPGVSGTSKLGVHLRFGTISIRELAKVAFETNKVFLNELIWREFYAMILFHFPHVVSHSFKAQYDNISWLNNETDFKAWCEGETGYPFVDAGMRELNATGYMHNRARMVTASFLTKHLLIDWRWGESYFASKLLDYELASNNGGWQWAAGCGTDAAPYFRIFNPELQLAKFDPNLHYVKKWVPEYGGKDYVKPIVEHSFARDRCLKAYKSAMIGPG
jgi:deoxyribodipyrimidine photo-lyase